MNYEQELGVGPTQLFENIELLKPPEAESYFKVPFSSAKYSLLNFSKPQSRETLHTKSSISDHTRTFIGRKLAL
jgi:hypothetical protein